MKMPRGLREPRTVGTARWLGVASVMLVLVALQMGAFGRLRLFGVFPEMLVVVVCSVALHRGPAVGFAVGFVFGFIMDLPGGHLVGLSAIGYGMAGVVAGTLGARVFAERWSVVVLAVGLGTVANQVVYVAGAHAFGYSLPWLDAGPRIVGALVAYHLLLTPIVYPVARRLTELFFPRGLDA